MSEDQPSELFTNSEVDLSKYPKAETLGMIRLEPTYKMVRYIQSALVSTVFTFIAFLVCHIST
jgi:hypothetical protein